MADLSARRIDPLQMNRETPRSCTSKFGCWRGRQLGGTELHNVARRAKDRYKATRFGCSATSAEHHRPNPPDKGSGCQSAGAEIKVRFRPRKSSAGKPRIGLLFLSRSSAHPHVAESAEGRGAKDLSGCAEPLLRLVPSTSKVYPLPECSRNR